MGQMREIDILIGQVCMRVDRDSKHEVSHTGKSKRYIWNSGHVVGEIQFHNDFAMVCRAHVLTGHNVSDIGKSYYHDPDFFDSMVKLVNEIPRPGSRSAFRYSGR